MLEPKPAFKERMERLLKEESEEFFEFCYRPLPQFIRCNTLKISPEQLYKRLSAKWDVLQPYSDYPEIMKIESKLGPGGLGKAREHLLGYYYVQGLSSMMPVLALQPTREENVLDLCASPGSKTTQIAARMENRGLLIANDNALDRIIVLNANLERCAVTNCIITREDGAALCQKLAKERYQFDKILVDASCSGEGVIRENIKAFMTWNEKMIRNFSRQQRRLLASALSILKQGGTLVYSTCTLAPEENEGVMQFALDNFNVELQEVQLPVKTRDGIAEWDEEQFNPAIAHCKRIYPQDNDAEGFFVAKLIKK